MPAAAKDWWEYYLEGKIVRRDDTPISIIRTIEDWCRETSASQKDDPFGDFLDGKPVKPQSLQMEISVCVGENSLDMERKRLKELELWGLREGKLAEAAKALREAEEEFNSAVKYAGLDSYHAGKLLTGPC